MKRHNDEIIGKLARVRNYMDQRRLDAVLLSGVNNFAWLTCGKDNRVVTASEKGASSLLITRSDKYVLTTNIEAPRIRDEELGSDFTMVSYPWHIPERRQALVKKIADNGNCASDDGTPGTFPLGSDFNQLRYALMPEEIARYRDLGANCAEIMNQVCREIQPGQTEAHVAARLFQLAAERRVTATVALIAADERIEKYRHPIYTGKPVKDRVEVVMCGMRWGLICSLTRLVNFTPVTDELKKKHQAVAAIDAAYILGSKPGLKLGNVLRAGIDVYRETNFDKEWKLHHQGGPTGYAGREFKVTPNEQRTVHLNQAFAWNPSITGTKSEDTIIVRQDTPEILTAIPDWPTITAEFEGQKIERPDILVV